MCREIIFIGDGRDFHAIDWYNTIKNTCDDCAVYYATDLLDSEGNEKLLKDGDKILDLINIDKYLFNNQTTFGNFWRNGIKLFFFPLQVRKLRKIRQTFPEAIFHAHTMYYLFICWLARLDFIGSPQGDEILIRPFRSKLYKYFAIKSLAAASNLIVDSENLKKGIFNLCGKEADIIQYGIDVEKIQKTIAVNSKKDTVVSIRALYPLYRIHEIIESRNRCMPTQPLSLFYPFWEDGYRNKILTMKKPFDTDLGRFRTKEEMYSFLSTCIMVISIPESDSSPRSVYESIFCGCCVVVSENNWIQSLPECMRSRVYIVDLNSPIWFEKAFQYAKELVKNNFIPTENALNMFDQVKSMEFVAKKYYRK